MKLICFTAIATLASLSSFAQDLSAPRVDPVPEMIQLMGRGIQSEDSEEVIFLACVDPENSCHRLRIVQLKPQKTPVWLGAEFPSENTIQVREDLKKWFKERRIDDIFSFLSNANNTYAFTEKNGWAWSNSPLKLRKKDFNRVSSSLIYYATYQHAAESEKSLVAIPKAQPEPRRESTPTTYSPVPRSEKVQLITKPKIAGLLFSSKAHPNGVCRTQGYEQAVSGSTKTDGSAVGPTMIVDTKGRIKSGEIVNSSSGTWISEILCMNPMNAPVPLDTPILISRPKLQGFLFSSKAHSDGICQTQGLAQAVSGTSSTNGNAVGATLITDSNGSIVQGEIVDSSRGAWIDQIVCLNPLDQLPQNDLVVGLNNPKSQGLYFSDHSHVDGVCRLLGYRKSLSGTKVTDGSAVGTTLVVDSNGSISGSEIVNSSSGSWISKLLCIQ